MKNFAFYANAKPYAKAIFELALAENTLDLWDKVLKLLAKAALEYEKNGLLKNPKIETDQKIGLFAEMVAKFPQAANLINLLARRKKLQFLPDIAFDYQKLYLAQQKVLEVKVSSVVELTAEQKDKLLQKIKDKYHKEVLLKYHLDGSLIGGVVVYLPDRVIDNSIKSMLRRLKDNLLVKSDHA